ncbi:MAG TPA: RagB/SusD family nutrient uptake outer membrane protein, partial [Puia sp.]|nr:RagB/SusD family nutrient uptake outer membrane protein [Puia sp.]
MKKLLYISIIAFSFFMASSCNKNLDVQPKNNATPDQFKTSADVETILFGAYEQLQNYGSFGEQYMLVPDLIASDSQVAWVGTYPEYKDIQHKAVVATNYVMGTLWGNSYKIVNAVNTVLDKLSIVDSADKATVEGECKFIRA